MTFLIFYVATTSVYMISTNVNSISMLNGNNFKDWKEML